MSYNPSSFSKVVLFSVLSLFGFGLKVTTAEAAAFTSAATGNFNVGTTWGGGCASACTQGTDYPGTSDSFTITSGKTVTVTATPAQTVVGITVNTGGILTTNAGFSLSATGAVAVAGTVNNNGTLTSGGALSGAGTITQGAAGVLNIGNTMGVTTLTATAVGNTVNYTGAAQAIKVTSYSKLTLSGSGAATGAVTTIGSDLTLSGTVSWATGANMTVGGNLTVGSGTTLTLGSTFTLGVTGATSVTGTVASSGTGVKTYTGLVTINSGGAWTNAGNSAVTLNGGFINNSAGVLAMGTGTHTLSATQTIDGTSGITFGGIVSISGAFTITNNNDATVTITGNLTGVSGSIWTQGTNSHLALGAAILATGTLNASAAGNTVEYKATGQTIIAPSSNYMNLTISGTNAVSTTVTVAGVLSVPAGGSFIPGAGTITLNNGASISNAATMTLFNVTVAASAAVTSATSFTIAGSLAIGASGTFSSTAGTVTMSGAAKTITGTASFANLAVTGTVTNTNTLTVSTALSGAGTLTQAATGVLNIGGTSAITTLTATAVGNTVNYTGSAQALKVTGYSKLTLSGSGTVTGAVATIGSDLTLSGTVSWTTGAAMTVGGKLIVGAGNTFATGATSTWTLAVTGATTVDGTLTLNNTGTKTFTGAVTIDSGGAWTNPGNSAVTLVGGFTNNSGGTLAMGTGTYTFTATQILDGTNGITFGGAVAISGAVTVTNNVDLTVTITGAFTGTVAGSTWVQGTNSTVVFANTVMTANGTLTASASPNTVQYSGAAQVIKTSAYDHLILSGSGAATGAVTTIASDLTLSGTVNWTTGASMTVGGNLTIGTGSTLTTGATFTLGVTGTTSVTGTLANSGSGAKTYTNAVTINSGGAWTNTGNSVVNFGGGFTNNSAGTLTMGTGTHTFTGNQIIDGTHGITFGGAVAISGATTVTNNNDLTVTITGALTGTVTGSTWAQGANATVVFGAAVLGTGTLTASASPNTVQYSGAAQAIKATTYDHLILSGSGAATGAVPTINSDLTTSGTVNWTTGANMTVGGNLTIGAGSTLTTGANFTLSVSGVTSVTGTMANSNTGAKAYSGAVTVNSGGAWTNTGNSAVTFSGGFTNNSAGTLTMGTGTHTFDTTQTIDGTQGITFGGAVAISGVTTVTNNNDLVVTIAGNLTGTVSGSAWTQGANSTLSVGGSLLATGTLNATVSSNTVQYTGASPAIKATTYDHLTVGGSGTATGAVSTVNSDLTLNGTVSWTTSADLTVSGNVSILGATLDTSGSSYDLNVGSSVIITAGVLNANASSVSVTQNWAFTSGTFNAGTSTVLIGGVAGSTSTITGTEAFYNLQCVTPNKVLIFTAGATTTIGNVLTSSGTAGNLLTMRSSTPGTAWLLLNNGPENVSFLRVQDSDARSGMMLTCTNNCVDLGNNKNWDFGGAGIKRTWWGVTDTVWSKGSNWDTGVPVSGRDSALIVSTATHMPTLTNNVSISTISIVATSSLTLNGFDLLVSSLSNAGMLVLEGVENVSTAPDNILGSSVIYSAASGTGVIYATWTYMNLAVAGGASLTPTNDLTVKQGLTLAAGKFLHGGNDLNFTGTTGTSGITTGGNPLYNVTFNGAGGTWIMLDSMTVVSSMTLTAGTLNTKPVTSNGISVGGEWIAAPGNYIGNASSVTFTGSGDTMRIRTGGTSFYKLLFTGSGNWFTDTNSLTVSSTVLVNAGTLTVVGGASMTVVGSPSVAAGGTLDLEGDTLISGGSLPNSGTVTGYSTATLTLTGAGVLGGSGSTAVPGLTLVTGAVTTTLAGPLTILGALNNPATHVLDTSAGNYGITIDGNWSNLGTFTGHTSSVTFTGSTPNGTIATNGFSFPTLYFNGGTWRNITNTVTVANNLVMDGGTFNVGGSSLTVLGDVDINAGATFGINNNVQINGGDMTNDGTITGLSSPTVTLNGAGTLGGAGSTTLPIFTMAGAAITTLGGPVVFAGSATISTTHTLDVSAGNYQITISSWFANNGATFMAHTGTVVANSTATITGSSSFYNFTAATPGITLTFQQGATTFVTNALTLTGGSGNRLFLRSVTPGQAALLTVSGSAALTQVDVKDSDARGGITLAPTLSLDSGNNRNWNFGGAAVRTWWGTVSTDWSNVGNWDSVVPGLSDKALIVSTATRMPTLTATVVTSTVSIVATSSLTLNGFDLLVSSVSNAGALVLQGIENVTAAPDNILGSSVIYTAASGSGVIYATWTYMNLYVNGPAIYTPTNDLSVKQALILTAGKFLHGGNDVNLIGTTGTNAITTGGNPLYNLIFNGAGGTWIMQDSMTVISSMTLTAGTLNTKPVTSNGLAVGAEWMDTGGSYVGNASSVTFTGSGNNLRIRTAGTSFYKLLFTGSGNWQTDTNSLTVSSTVLVGAGSSLTVVGGASMTVVGSPSVAAGGTLDLEGDTLISGGSLPNYGSVAGYSTATLTLMGAGVVGGSGSTALPGLTLSGGGVSTTLAGPVFIQGTLNNPATHTLDASGSNFAITMGGNWLNLGIFNAHTSSVTFTGSTSNGTIATDIWAFYNLSFNGGVWRNITNTVTVSSSLYINGGSFNVGGSSLTVTGSIDVNAGGTLGVNNDVAINGGSLTNDGTITALSSPTITLAGAGTLGGAGATNLPIFTMTGGQTTTLGGPVVFVGSATIATGHTLDVSASNYQVTISSWFANNGTFTAQAGTVIVNSTATLTGSTTFYNFAATTPGVTLTMQAGTTQYVTHTWSVAGTLSNKIKFRSTGAAYTYRVSVSSYVSFVDVQNCVASSQTIYAGQTSSNGGGNGNWIFDFPPNAIVTFTGSSLGTGDIQLNWTAPLDPDDNPLAAGSQFLLEWSTYTAVLWSTSTVGDTGQSLTSHFFISTSAVSAGSLQVILSTGLSGNVPYYFQIWTKDPLGLWSQGLSAQATATPVPLLGITLTAHSYDFGSVNMTATTISTSAVTVTNVGNVPETYALSVATTGASGVWGVGTSTPTTMDHFVLFGGFNPTAPSPGAFVNIDALTNTSATSTAGIFAIGENGLSTPLGSTRDLWFRLDMPPTTSTTTQQQMTVTVTASTP